MQYTVIKDFEERFDNDYPYAAGDAYPREGFAPPEGRAEALATRGRSPMNAMGLQYLEPRAGSEDVPGAEEEELGEGTPEEPTAPKNEPATPPAEGAPEETAEKLVAEPEEPTAPPADKPKATGRKKAK